MTQQDLYARLELISPEQQEQAAAPHARLDSEMARESRQSRWSQLGHAIVNYLVGAQAQDPTIWTKRDRKGHLYYEAYDPVTQTRHHFDSERAVRVWLDERYYQ
ncbi:MAG: hypothetical protein AAGH67_12155 [Cyanobacteria bacterium P01_H01_bin.162]